MADPKTIIEQAYSAFNKRDIDGALALMTQDVSWPKASEGGKVVGKEEIRGYLRKNTAFHLVVSSFLCKRLVESCALFRESVFP
jgi:ketosteroid isomerase-like protein